VGELWFYEPPKAGGEIPDTILDEIGHLKVGLGAA
jgi:hypothetical protein